MTNWRDMTPAEKQSISERVMLLIDQNSAAPSSHAQLFEIFRDLGLARDVQSGVEHALKGQGFITRVGGGVQVTTEGAAHVVGLRSKQTSYR
jgi:hypothetical protein